MLKNQSYAQFVNIMLQDLKNERKHMHFYLVAASLVSGPHREEYKELFEKEASSEMKHVLEFQNALLGLDVDLKEAVEFIQDLPHLCSYDVKELLQYALEMEQEVVANYANRIVFDVPLLDEPDRKYMEIFYEKQIEKSREDVDNYKMILRNFDR